MKKAYLKRQEDNGIITTGIFFFDSDEGVKTLASLELPWLENKRSVSCIPKGTYEVTTTFSNRFQKPMWLLKDVPNRSGIRIHSANYSKQLEGCIALGQISTDINEDGIMDIAESKKAIKLAKFYLGNNFTLDIL